MLHDPLQLQTIMENSHLLVGSELDYAPLLDLVGDGRLVLIGTTSHGTHEFYRTRAYIAKPLMPEEGFIVVAAEAGCARRTSSERVCSRARPKTRTQLKGIENFAKMMEQVQES